MNQTSRKNRENPAPPPNQLDAILDAALPMRGNARALLTFYQLELEATCGVPDPTLTEALAMLDEPDGMAALIRVATRFHKVMTR